MIDELLEEAPYTAVRIEKLIAESEWGEVFSDNTIAATILDRVLHHSTVINIKSESYRLKDRKEFMGKKEVISSLLSN